MCVFSALLLSVRRAFSAIQFYITHDTEERDERERESITRRRNKISQLTYFLLVTIDMPISILSTHFGSKETFSPVKSRVRKDGRKIKNIKFLRMYEKKIFRKRRRSRLQQTVAGEWLEDRRDWYDILNKDAS